MENPASARAELLSRYVDGHLSGEELARFEVELREDSRLRDELAQWQGMRNRLQSAVRSQRVPGDLESRVLARTSGANVFSKPAYWGRLRLAAVAAFCLLLLLTSWMLLRDQTYSVADLPPQIARLMEIGVGKHVSCVKERVGSTAFPLGKYNTSVPSKYKDMLDAAKRALPADFKLVELHICGTGDRQFAHLTLTRADGYLSVLLTERRDGDPTPNDPSVARATVGDIQIYAAREEGMEVGVFTLPTEFAFVVSDYTATQNLEYAREVAGALQ